MCRHSISIRLSSGAYGIKYLIINPFFFHRAIYSSNSSLLCMEELSITTTVFFLIFLQKSFKQATTTVGRPNRLLALDRFLDSTCQSRLSHAWWRSIFSEKGFIQARQLRPIGVFITI